MHTRFKGLPHIEVSKADLLRDLGLLLDKDNCNNLAYSLWNLSEGSKLWFHSSVRLAGVAKPQPHNVEGSLLEAVKLSRYKIRIRINPALRPIFAYGNCGLLDSKV